MAREYQQPSVSAELEEELEEERRIYIDDRDDKPCNKVIYHEIDVLKAYNRTEVDSDNWVQHELRDVSAVDQDGNIVNLLFSARDGHTFTVLGQIVVDQDFAKYCKCMYTPEIEPPS